MNSNNPYPQQPYYQQPPQQQQQQMPPQQQDYYNIQSRGGPPMMPNQPYQQPPPQPQQQQQQQSMYPPQVQPAGLRAGGGGGGISFHRPPYMDPDTHIAYDTANAEYEGWLTKQSVWLKEWRRRYFILKGSKLFFAKNEYAAPHGMMDLAHCTTVKSADLKSKKRHSFEISTPELQYLLYADSESQKDDWIGRVGKAIVRCSRTYYDQSAAAGGGATHQQVTDAAHREVYQYNEEDDDIYTNDDHPNNPYFND